MCHNYWACTQSLCSPTRERNWESEVAQSCLTLCDPMDCSPPGSSVCRILGKSTGVGCHVLLQGIFLTQGSNPGLLYCRQALYHLSYQRSPIRGATAKRSHCNEKPKHQNRKSSPYLLQLEKTCVLKWRSSTAKNKINKFLKLGVKLNHRLTSPFHIEKLGGK